MADCRSLRSMETDGFQVVTEVVTHKLNHIPIFKGDFGSLSPNVQRFVAEKAELMNPAGIYICDGSQKEYDDIVDKLVERGVLTPLKAYENKWVKYGVLYKPTPQKSTKLPMYAVVQS